MSNSIIFDLEAFLETNPTGQEVKSWLSGLTAEESLECGLRLLRLSPTGFTRVFDTKYVAKDADRLSDEELFARMAAAMDDCIDTSREKIGLTNPQTNPEPVSRLGSLYNEAVARGFQRDDIGFGMRPFHRQSKKLAPFKPEPQWKAFEKLVARIHIALCRDADIKWSDTLVDKSGTERQIDVTVRSKTGPHKVLTIVSCKDKSRPVSIIDVEAFITVKQDLDAALAIVVSSSGYQEGALAKAKAHDVRLWTLEEAEKIAWRDELRDVKLFFHMFSDFKFYPALPSNVFPQGVPIDLAAITITATDGRTVELPDAFQFAIQDATQRCLPIPCWVAVNLPPGSKLAVMGQAFPIDRIELHFTRKLSVREQKQIRVPAGALYNLKRTDGESHFLTERDLPPLS